MDSVRLLLRICWPMVFYGLLIDAASLLFRNLGGLACTFIGAVAAIPFLWKAYGGEKNREQRLSLRDGLMCVFGGIAACVLVNTLIRVSGIAGIFTGFSLVSEQFYRPPLWLQVCAMGVGIPLAEELVFRGLVFGTVRKNRSFGQAAVMSALLFGIYHGNVLQGAYGFFMGILLAWVMERRRTISAPVLMHMSANMTSVVMTLAWSMR